MNKIKKSPYVIVIVILLLLFSFDSNLIQQFFPTTSTTDNTYISETFDYNFRNDNYLDEHYEKHKSEFNNISKAEYLSKANALINNNSITILTKKEKEDGDLVYYDPDLNELLILSTDGYIRTFFKPSDGIDYYNKK